MKKLLGLLFALVVTFSMIPTAFAAGAESVTAANALHELGLFNGTGTTADGKPFDEYELEIEDGSGSVSKNPDDTFTVNFPAKDSCSISLYYNFQKHETVNDKGETTTSISRTKRSLGFDIPIPSSGFAVSRKNWTLLPGITFGQNTTPYYVLDVYYNGVRIDDYAITSSASAFTASIQADGSLLLMKTGSGGRGQFTVSYQGKTASFGAVG